ncbi:MAG: ribose ABC transporter permease [Cyanobacteria bacterium]|nr:ribose ABC transporter permease [Cyanobacteriota bacterium]
MKIKISREIFQRLITLIILILMCIVFSIISHAFFSIQNIINILRQVTMVVVTACGFTLLLINGSLDLSVGGVLALSGCVAAGLASQHVPLFLAFIIGILVGGTIGVINGILVVGFRISAVIATLGTMYVARGLAYIYTANVTGGGLGIVRGLPNNFNALTAYIWKIPVPIIFLAFTVILFIFIQSKTIFGKYVYAIGGNQEAARLSGINVSKIKFVLFVIVGILAGISGIIMASRIGSGQPNSGIGFEFDVIVAVILGGTSLSGGEGSVTGTLIGALIVGVLGNALNLLGVQTFYQYIASGIVLIFAVILDTTLKRQGIDKETIRRLIRG